MTPNLPDTEAFLTSAQWEALDTVLALTEPDQHVDGVKQLIASGFPPLALADFGAQKINLAEIAANSNSSDLVIYLQQQYPNMVNGSSHVLLALLSQEEVVRQLVENGYPLSKVIASTPELMDTISQAAITTSTMSMLVDHGLNLDAPARIRGLEIQPLNWAARGRNPDLLEHLLDNGASPSLVDSNGRHFLHWAVTEGRIVRSSEDDDEQACDSMRKIVGIAATRSIPLDVQDNDGNTPLHLAAKMGYMNKAAMLVEHGASTTLINNKGKTPVQLAKAGKRTETLQAIQAAAAKRAIMRMAFPNGCPRP